MIEVLLSISILSVIGLVLSTLIFSGMSASSKGSAELYVGADLNKDLSRLLMDYQNGSTHNISNIGITNGDFIIYTASDKFASDGMTLRTNPIHYSYDKVNKTLTRDGKVLLKNVEKIKVSVYSESPKIERLEVNLEFNYNGEKILVPPFYVTKRIY